LKHQCAAEKLEEGMEIRGNRADKCTTANSNEQSQRRMWNDHLLILIYGDNWIAVMFANPQTGATVQALNNTYGKQVYSISKRRSCTEQSPSD
jgi:hypothetical protein